MVLKVSSVLIVYLLARRVSVLQTTTSDYDDSEEGVSASSEMADYREHYSVNILPVFHDNSEFLKCKAKVRRNPRDKWMQPEIRWFHGKKVITKFENRFEILHPQPKSFHDGYVFLESVLRILVPSNGSVITCEAGGDGVTIHQSIKLDCPETNCLGDQVICIGYKRRKCFCRDEQLALIPVGFNNTEEKCLKPSKFMENCQFSEQCRYFDDNAQCVLAMSRCTCKYGFKYKKARCIPIPIGPAKPVNPYLNKNFYKAAMVALGCFLITIIGLFILFLCNRSFMRRSRDYQGPIDDRYASSNDIFNVTDGLAAMRNADKPPTYQEVIVQDQMVHGSPPPDYTEATGQRRTDRAASLLARMAINAQLEVLARHRMDTGQALSTSVPRASAPPDTGIVNQCFTPE